MKKRIHFTRFNKKKILEPGKAILDYAEQNNIDLIVMGAFGHSRIHDLILGGTTAYIIRKSSIPILLQR